MLRLPSARLSLDQRQRVVELMLPGQSVEAVGRQVCCDYRTVQRWLHNDTSNSELQ